MNNRKLAAFILGMVDQSVASELPEKEHLDLIEKDLKTICETNLYYYLVSGYENDLLCRMRRKNDKMESVSQFKHIKIQKVENER